VEDAWPWLTEPKVPGVVDFLSRGVQDALEGRQGRLGEPDAEILARYERELIGLDGRLSAYRDMPEPLPLDDSLAATLSRARELLEAVHHRTIRFPGEDRALRMNPKFGTVEGEVLVLDADDLYLDQDSPVELSPTTDVVKKGGKVTVARIKRINPPVLRPED
jgi:hypothetical protein